MIGARILTDAVVHDAQLEPAVALRRRHHDVSWRGTRRDAVPDGVFHEWLEHEIGHERESCLRSDSEGDLQTILKSDLLDLDVVRKQLQLARQRDLLLARA